MTMTINGTGSITGLSAGGLPDGSVLPADTQVGALPSMIRVGSSTGSSFGSTNTAIRYFTTSILSQGTDITAGGSVTTLGQSFTINTNGVYVISYSDNYNTAATIGISISATGLSTTVVSLPLAEILALGTTLSSGAAACVSWTGYLAAGSIIRPHGVASVVGGASPSMFTIARVA